MVAALAMATSGIAAVAPGAGADEPVVITGKVTASTGISFDSVFVEACPGAAPTHSFQPVCTGGVLATASNFNGWYSLTLPGTGEWSVKAVGLYCGAPHLSPSSTGPVTGSTTRNLVIDASGVAEPATRDLAPPFADGADPAGETDPSDDLLHLALRDETRRILVGGLPGGPCVQLHVPYRPLQVLVLKPAGDGPFPLVVMSHGGGEQMPNAGKVSAAQGFVGRGYAVAIPTYPLTARYGLWPGGYLRDIDDQAVDLAFILDELLDLPFVDGDRIGLTGVSAGGFTSLLAAFHESGFDGGIRGVATEIARPLTAPNELDVAAAPADVPLFMANNVDDTTTVFGPADAFWVAGGAPKYRWLEDTPAEIPSSDHGFSTQDAPQLIDLFLDAYVKGDAAARSQLAATTDPATTELTFEAVPGSVGFRGPLAKPVESKRGRTVPIEVELFAKDGDHATLDAVITGPGGPFTEVLVFDRLDGTYQGQWRTKGLAAGTYTATVSTSFGELAQTITLR